MASEPPGGWLLWDYVIPAIVALTFVFGWGYLQKWIRDMD